MRRAIRWGVLVTLVAGTLATVPAGADDTGTREAKRRFEEGIARTQAGDWEAARLSFRQSLAAAPSQNALFNLALTEEKCARPFEALSHFKQYVEWHSLSQSDRAQAQRHIADLMAKAGHIEVHAPSGTVLGLDAANDVGTAPLAEPLDVTPGHHVVMAKMGQETKTAEVDAVAGQLTRVAFEVEERAAAAPAANLVAPSLAAPRSPAAPVATGSALPTATAMEQPTTSSGPSTARIATVASIGGTAIVAGLAGLYFGQQSNSDADSAGTLRQQNPVCAPVLSPGCQHLQDVLRSAHTEHVTADVLFVVSGALAVAAVSTWALWPTGSRSGSSTTGWRVVPTAGREGAGVMAVGSF